MTERDEYTPSLHYAADLYVRAREQPAHDAGQLPARRPDEYRAEFARMIEAVRQEEREKAAQIAESLYFGGGNVGSTSRWAVKQAAARIRAQGKEPAPSEDASGYADRLHENCGHPNHGSRDHDCAPFREQGKEQGT